MSALLGVTTAVCALSGVTTAVSALLGVTTAVRALLGVTTAVRALSGVRVPGGGVKPKAPYTKAAPRCMPSPYTVNPSLPTHPTLTDMLRPPPRGRGAGVPGFLLSECGAAAARVRVTGTHHVRQQQQAGRHGPSHTQPYQSHNSLHAHACAHAHTCTHTRTHTHTHNTHTLTRAHNTHTAFTPQVSWQVLTSTPPFPEP